jgi:hypothetical protein
VGRLGTSADRRGASHDLQATVRLMTSTSHASEGKRGAQLAAALDDLEPFAIAAGAVCLSWDACR